MGGQIFARSRQAKIVLIERRFADEKFEKARSFEPPMTEQLRVEGNDNDCIDIGGNELTRLRAALFEKMRGMCIGCLFGGCSVIKLLFLLSPSDPVIFHAGKLPNPAADRAEVLEWEIESNVSIKFAIRRIARITFFSAPNLSA